MAIKINNLDLTDAPTVNSVFSVQTALGHVTAASDRTVFVAPVACRVTSIDIYSQEAIPPASTTASTTTISIRAELGTDSDALLQVRGTSATTTTTNSILVGQRYRLTPSANNSLTAGQTIVLATAVGGSATLSGSICVVTYTPLIHR
jgi:type II secretory pathway component PulC